MGAYFQMKEETFNKQSADIKNILCSLSRLADRYEQFGCKRSYESFALLINDANKSYSAKSYDTSNRLANYMPAEVKVQNFLENWHHFNSFFELNVDLVLPRETSKQSLQKQFLGSISGIADCVKSACGLLGTDNSFLSDAVAVVASPSSSSHAKKGKGGRGAAKPAAAVSPSLVEHAVHLVTAVADPDEAVDAMCAAAATSQDGCARLHLEGRLPLLACAPPKASGVEVLAALKLDLARTLHARLGLVAEELGVTSGRTEVEEKTTTRTLLPQRVLLRSAAAGLACLRLSDYAFASETREECAERVAYFCGGARVLPEELDYGLETVPAGISSEDNLSEVESLIENVENVKEVVSRGQAQLPLILAVVALLIALAVGVIMLTRSE